MRPAHPSKVSVEKYKFANACCGAAGIWNRTLRISYHRCHWRWKLRGAIPFSKFSLMLLDKVSAFVTCICEESAEC
jgi:hypothetical protein